MKGVQGVSAPPSGQGQLYIIRRGLGPKVYRLSAPFHPSCQPFQQNPPLFTPPRPPPTPPLPPHSGPHPPPPYQSP